MTTRPVKFRASVVARLSSSFFALTILTLVSVQSASATTFLYTFSFTAQDVLNAVSPTSTEGVYAFFLAPSILTGYSFDSEGVSPTGTAWTAGEITDPSDNHTGSYAYFAKPTSGSVALITTTPSAFSGHSYAGTGQAPYFWGGGSQPFAATELSPSTVFNIRLTTLAPVNNVAFKGIATGVYVYSAGPFPPFQAKGKSFEFNMTLQGQQAVPEPGTWGLLLTGVVLMLARTRIFQPSVARCPEN